MVKVVSMLFIFFLFCVICFCENYIFDRIFSCIVLVRILYLSYFDFVEIGK